jgi:chromosome segregation ATPase
MSAAKGTAQKAAVRVIASELDRRSGPLEQAIRDLTTRMDALAAEQTSSLVELRRHVAALQTQVGDLQRTQASALRATEELAGRVRAREVDANQLDVALRGIQAELLTTQEDLSRLHAR